MSLFFSFHLRCPRILLVVFANTTGRVEYIATATILVTFSKTYETTAMQLGSTIMQYKQANVRKVTSCFNGSGSLQNTLIDFL